MFYQSIANVYDYIFPQNKMQRSFIESIRPIEADDHILDIGCATGNLTSLLAEKSQHVTGLDLDHDLLVEAEKKYPSMNFIEMNMLDIQSLNTTYDLIVSFGNTLVHLPSLKDVESFFEKVYQSLKPGGHCMIQIINYDRILDQEIDHLPTIDNDHIHFDRKYHVQDDHVNFITDLTIKSNGQVIHNAIPLLALRRKDIENSLNRIGFSDLHFYGDLKGQPVTDDSIPLLFTCKRSL